MSTTVINYIYNTFGYYFGKNDNKSNQVNEQQNEQKNEQQNEKVNEQKNEQKNDQQNEKVNEQINDNNKIQIINDDLKKFIFNHYKDEICNLDTLIKLLKNDNNLMESINVIKKDSLYYDLHYHDSTSNHIDQVILVIPYYKNFCIENKTKILDLENSWITINGKTAQCKNKLFSALNNDKFGNTKYCLMLSTLAKGINLGYKDSEILQERYFLDQEYYYKINNYDGEINILIDQDLMNKF